MTLREYLRELVADESARATFERDPAAALASEGFDDLDPELIPTALVHYADAAGPDELDDLLPLLERYGPLADADLATGLAADRDPALTIDDPPDAERSIAEDTSPDETPHSDHRDDAEMPSLAFGRGADHQPPAPADPTVAEPAPDGTARPTLDAGDDPDVLDDPLVTAERHDGLAPTEPQQGDEPGEPASTDGFDAAG